MATQPPGKKPPSPPAAPAPAKKQTSADKDFIGHDARTVVDMSLADLKRQHEAQKAAKARGAPDLTAPVPAHRAPALDDELPGEPIDDEEATAARDPEDDAPDEDRAAAPVGDDDAGDVEASGEDADAGDDEDAGDDMPEKLTAADLEGLTKLKLPQRLRTFFDKGEVARFDGWYSPKLDSAASLPLQFLHGALPMYWEYATDGHFELPSKKLMPFAACGDGDGTFFVAVDTASLKLPVHFFDYEEGFKPVAASFDEFLKGLVQDEPEYDPDAGLGGDEDDGGGGGELRRGPNGKPLDRDGVEWDWVTNEGMGFNDEDDDDAMTLEKNGKTYFKPDWGDWSTRDWVGYWSKQFEIEESQSKGEKAFQAALKKHGLRNRNHWKRVQATFLRHYGNDTEFTEAALVARGQQGRQMMQNAVTPGLLDPVEGVSLETYATVTARRANLPNTPGAFPKLLAQFKLDEAKWARAEKAWTDRMSGAGSDDPMAAMAVNTEFAKYFAAAGQGQFGAAGQAASKSQGINAKVVKQSAGGEPCTFERYVEIQTAQSVWATQGKDVNGMLKKVFNLTAMDFSNLSAWWAPKMGTDIKLMMEVYPKLEAKYRERYSGGGDDPDSDLSV